MPDSLLFDGVDDVRTYSPGNVAGSGALTVVCVVKPDATSHYQFIQSFNLSSRSGCSLVDTEEFRVNDNVTEPSGGPTITTGEWWLLGMTRAAGSTTPRYHTYRYSTTTWAHSNWAGTMANFPATTSIRFGFSAGEQFQGSLLIAGIWDSELSDGTMETLEADTASWTTAAPDEAWRFDTVGTITPFVGTSTQTASTGGTLDTGDAPAGWSDGAAVAQVMARAFNPIPFL